MPNPLMDSRSVVVRLREAGTDAEFLSRTVDVMLELLNHGRLNERRASLAQAWLNEYDERQRRGWPS